MYRRNYITLGILVVILIFGVVALVVNPIFGRDGFKLGLDLKGGVNIQYKVQFPEGVTPGSTQANLDMDRAITIIQNRIDRYGVAGPIVQKVGNDQIAIQLPGISDRLQAEALVQQTGFLEFREVEVDSSGNPVTLSNYTAQTTLAFVDQSELAERYFSTNADSAPVEAILQRDAEGNLGFVDTTGASITLDTLKARTDLTTLYSWIASRGSDGTQLTGSLLSSATAELNTTSTGASPDVKIVWNGQGSTIFDQVAARLYIRTQNSVQRELGIFLDKELISAPQINAQSYGGTGIIQGTFTTAQVNTLANLLSSGSLPMPLITPPTFENQITPTLGSRFTELSAIAGVIALVLIMIFMIAYYRVPGVMASIALLFYSVVILAIFKLWPVTLNLAGIGGFVLSLGMAVDANVIIFERMKEEIRTGRTLGAAIEAGFNRAWLAIRDSNITTIISCIILIWIGGIVPGGQSVRGFGITLLIGVAISMFTCITVTRTLLRLFVGTETGKKSALFSVFTGRKQ